MKRYYLRTNGAEILLALFSFIIVTGTIFRLFYGIKTPIYIILDILIIIGWSISLFASVWLFIVDRFNLSYVQIEGENVIKRNGFLKTVNFTCDYRFEFIEKKDRLIKVKVLDKEGRRITVIGNRFELNLKEFQLYVNSKNLSNDE